MIGLLKGIIAYKDISSLIIDVQGVGYKVLPQASVLAKATVGGTFTLFIHTHVREDLLELYGFETADDLRLFEYLIGVSGVGCKTALGIFSVGQRVEIIQAITTGDMGFFTTVPRLGKKNAQKIIIELKNKLGGEGEFDVMKDGTQNNEVIAALTNFGFSSYEARNALKAIAGQGNTPEEKIRLALKQLGR